MPPSDKPRCKEFTLSELCTTTTPICYNLDDSDSGGLRSKREQFGTSKMCLLPEITSPPSPPCSPKLFCVSEELGFLYLLVCLIYFCVVQTQLEKMSHKMATLEVPLMKGRYKRQMCPELTVTIDFQDQAVFHMGRSSRRVLSQVLYLCYIKSKFSNQ